MKNIISNIESKKSLIIIIYIFCILFIGILSIFLKLQVLSEDNFIDEVIIETSKLNTSNAFNKETMGSIKIEGLKYDELSYFIKVNCKAQTVTIYTCDETGEYNVPIKSMLCSTGNATPKKGIFTISDKYNWRFLVGDVYGQYATRITGSILFHSVPYVEKDKSTLEYWEFDKLGQPVSKGCVRLSVEDAKWIFDYCEQGTQVEFYESDESGPLGKPSQITISDCNDELRNWDPTDPDENNPWLNFNKNNIKGENI